MYNFLKNPAEYCQPNILNEVPLLKYFSFYVIAVCFDLPRVDQQQNYEQKKNNFSIYFI